MEKHKTVVRGVCHAAQQTVHELNDCSEVITATCPTELNSILYIFSDTQ